ncbi:hypothetical protein EsH8_VIII_000746 [Colletotrichum jinshuiense]
MASARQACSNALRASSRVAAPGAASRRCFAAAPRPGALSSSVYSHATVVSSRWRVAAIPAPRFYSSGSDDYHKTSATGSKLWDFEQVAELAKDPKDVVIVDSREPGELVETGRIPTAINIPVATAPDSFHISEEEFEDRYGFPRPGQDAELVIYCKAGVRSRALASLARDAGWKNVGEYPGSFLDWQKNGGDVERGGRGPGQE